MSDKRTNILNKIAELLSSAKTTIGYKSLKVADYNRDNKYPNIAIYWEDSKKQKDVNGDSTGYKDIWDLYVIIDLKIHDYSGTERLTKTNEIVQTIEDILKDRNNRRLDGLCYLMDYYQATPGRIFTGNKVIKQIQFKIKIIGY